MVGHPLQPYEMCSKEECDDRERAGEVSAFECTDDTRYRPPNRRIVDPTRAVAKYRRSAAGGSSADRYPLRTASQLEATVSYLLDVLAERRPPHLNTTITPSSERKGESLLSTVAFVEDRIRAVQVDLVKLRHASRDLQARLVRCHILILFLTADCPQYEHHFGHKALQTALSAFREASEPHQLRSDDARETGSFDDDGDDELWALECVYHLGQELLRASSEGSTRLEFSALSLASCLQNLIAKRPRSQIILPQFQWSLSLVLAVLLGHWHIALRTLRQGPQSPHNGDSALATLTRCLLAPCLPWMRRQCLEVCNASFRKGEAVPAAAVSHLLQFDADHGEVTATRSTVISTWDDDPPPPGPSEAQAAALAFGRALGLPQDSHDCLLFKVAPVRSAAELSHLPVRDDVFVLGLNPRELIPDGDGVLLPPTDWMRAILRSRLRS